MEIREGLTFDDVLLQPRASNILPADADLKTRLTREITINVPLVSAAMDTVTEARMASAMAQAGGEGTAAHDIAGQIGEIKHTGMTLDQQGLGHDGPRWVGLLGFFPAPTGKWRGRSPGRWGHSRRLRRNAERPDKRHPGEGRDPAW